MISLSRVSPALHENRIVYKDYVFVCKQTFEGSVFFSCSACYTVIAIELRPKRRVPRSSSLVNVLPPDQAPPPAACCLVSDRFVLQLFLPCREHINCLTQIDLMICIAYSNRSLRCIVTFLVILLIKSGILFLGRMTKPLVAQIFLRVRKACECLCLYKMSDISIVYIKMQ